MTKRQAAKPSPGPESVTPDKADPPESPRPPSAPRHRCVDIDGAAVYLGVSPDTVRRMTFAGVVPVVKLPVERSATGRGKVGVCRRELLDLRDLDTLIDESKEWRGAAGQRHVGRERD